MPDPTIRRDALDLTGCTDAEHAAILSAGWLWVETLPADDGSTHGMFVRVVDVSVDANPLDEGDYRDRVGRHGVVIARHSFRHWHTLGGICRCTARSNMALVDWDSHYGPLRFAESDA